MNRSQLTGSNHFLCNCNTCGNGLNGSCYTDFMCNVATKSGRFIYNCINKVNKALCSPREYDLDDYDLCCNTSRCNTLERLVSVKQYVSSEKLTAPSLEVTIPCISIAVLVSLFLAVAIGYMLWRRTCCRSRALLHEDSELTLDTSCSGSGSGVTKLVESTIAKKITLLEPLDRGKYGNVCRASYQDREVVIKIFLSKDEESFRRETEIYTTRLMNHDNILSFIASDITSQNSVTQFWIITQYHPNGSCYNYIHENQPIETKDVLKMLRTAAAGLSYLHASIKSRRHNKPAIAHRDVKTKNILVKMDGSCCIADLGYSLLESESTNHKGFPYQVGTVRYLAPELLDGSIDLSQFSSFLQADVYAFTLVIWEVLANTKKGYQLPFDAFVPPNPSLDDMRLIVSQHQLRPGLEILEMSSEMLTVFKLIISEGWRTNPKLRPNMFYLHKRLNKLLNPSKSF